MVRCRRYRIVARSYISDESPLIMWDPETSITCQEGHIYANFRRFDVEREDLLARNWQALEAEVYYGSLSRL